MTNPHFLPFLERPERWRWLFIVEKDQILAVSAKTYPTKADCIAAINFIKGSGSAPIL